MLNKSDNSFFFLRFHFFHVLVFLSEFGNFEIRKSSIELFRFIFCVCVALCSDKVHTDSISVSLKLRSHSSPLSQTRSWKLQFCII